MADRSHAEIAQDLRADADLAPLLVTIRFDRFHLIKGRRGNTRRAVAQIDQNTAAIALEVIERGACAIRARKNITYDIGL